MADGSLARRYARALILLGQENNALDAVGAGLGTIGAVLDLNDGQLRGVLVNPGVPLAERHAVLSEVLRRLSLHGYVNNFLRLLLDKSRFSVLPEITLAFGEMADELAGRVRATVRTARALDAVTSAQVEGALAQATGRTVVVRYVVEPGLIGGMVAQVGDKVYDSSVRGRLEQLQLALTRDLLSAPQSASAEA
ncbi:MAG: synthase delta subunit [Pseudomonadota bacterium]|jgi:F-type H+-transporting ATPase subunit delta